MAGGPAAVIGSAALSQMPSAEGSDVDRRPGEHDGDDGGERRHAAAPCHQADHQHRQHHREAGVGEPHPNGRAPCRRHPISCAIADAITSTPGSTGSNGEGKTSPPPVTVAPITTIRPRRLVARRAAVEHGGGAQRVDAAARTVEGERQRVAEIGRNEAAAKRQSVRSDRRLIARGASGDAQRERRFDAAAVGEDHRHEARRPGAVGGDVDHADRRDVGEALQRQHEAVRFRDLGEYAAAGFEPLRAVGEHCCCGQHGGGFCKRRRQRRGRHPRVRDRPAACRRRSRRAHDRRSRRPAAPALRGTADSRLRFAQTRRRSPRW